MKTQMNLEAVADASIVLPSASSEPAAASGNPGPAGATPPANATPSPAARPATLQELKAACPGADAGFLMAQLEANATASQGQTAWMAKLAADNAAQAKELADLKQREAVAAAAAPLKKPGAAAPVSALPKEGAAAAADETDPIAAFNAAVAEEMQRSKTPRHVAHGTVCRTQPELRKAMVEAHNRRRRE